MSQGVVDDGGLEFELEDDDLMDEDVDGGGSPHIPKLKSAITGKRTKGRGFRDDDIAVGTADHRLSAAGYDSLDSSGGPEPKRSIEGWIILVTGVHEEAQEDNLQEDFGEFGEIKNLHLNLDRRTGFVKGYALIEYGTFENAQNAIKAMDGAELLTQTINVDWAFSRGPFKGKRGGPRRRSRSPIRKH